MAEAWPVLIAGAGPAGLTCALSLADAGVPVVVCEAGADLALDLRAGTYHPPTLEMLERWGIPERMMALGAIQVRTWQIRDREAGVSGGFRPRATGERHQLSLSAAPRTAQADAAAAGKIAVLSAFFDAVRHARRRRPPERRWRRRSGGAKAVGGISSAARISWAPTGPTARCANRMGVEFEGFTWDEGFLIVSTTYDFEPHGFAKATYIADPERMGHVVQGAGFQPAGALAHRAADGSRRGRAPRSWTTPRSRRGCRAFCRARRLTTIVHRNAYRVHQRVAKTYNLGPHRHRGRRRPRQQSAGRDGAERQRARCRQPGRQARGAMEGRGRAGGARPLHAPAARPAIEYVQRITIENKRFITERDPAQRRARQDEMRRIGADKKLAYEYLLNSSMIAMVRKAEGIR